MFCFIGLQDMSLFTISHFLLQCNLIYRVWILNSELNCMFNRVFIKVFVKSVMLESLNTLQIHIFFGSDKIGDRVRRPIRRKLVLVRKRKRLLKNRKKMQDLFRSLSCGQWKVQTRCTPALKSSFLGKRTEMPGLNLRSILSTSFREEQ